MYVRVFSLITWFRRRRSRSASRGRKRVDDPEPDPVSGKTMLMSTEEALVMVHGDMATIRDGDVTHQLIQTNLADVICGGNPSDKVLYPRSSKYRASSLSVPRSPDRRGSFRLWRSSRRLRRSASTRTIAKHYVDTTSSSTETSAPSTPSPSEWVLTVLSLLQGEVASKEKIERVCSPYLILAIKSENLRCKELS